MPEIEKSLAVQVIREGALGIGEDHTKPDGRNLAIELIEGGYVKKLFLEFPPLDDWVSMLEKATEKAPQGVDAVRGRIGFGVIFHCSVAIEQVAAVAIVHGATVHLVDHKVAMNPTRNGTTGGMKMRNITIAQGVMGATGTQSACEADAIGSLLLFGGAHFEGAASIVAFYQDLRWVRAG